MNVYLVQLISGNKIGLVYDDFDKFMWFYSVGYIREFFVYCMVVKFYMKYEMFYDEMIGNLLKVEYVMVLLFSMDMFYQCVLQLFLGGLV